MSQESRSSPQPFVQELARILVEKGDAQELLTVFDRQGGSPISFETLVALSHALGQSFINCGPDIRGICTHGEIPPLDAPLVQHLAVRSVTGDRKSFDAEASRLFGVTDPSQFSESERTLAFHTAAARDRVAKVLDGIFAFGQLASPDQRLDTHPAPHIPLVASRDVPQQKFPDEVLFTGPVSRDEGGTAKLAHFDADFTPDKAILVPPVDAEHMERFLREKLSHVQWLDVRGIDGSGTYNRLRDGVALDLRFLHMLPSRGPADFVAAAAHARHQKKTFSAETPDRLKLFDSRFVRGRYSSEGGDISLQKAFERRYDFMDLPTFLQLCSSPDFDDLRESTNPVLLNHVLPDGSFVQASWGQDRLLFREHPGDSSSFRVFPVV